MTFNLDGYVDVAERIRQFYAKFPDGRLQTVEHGHQEVGGKVFVYCKAAAYRAPDDPTPCNGVAWEPIPGPTPYTRDSELMNAETAAWGRAIVAAGIPSTKVASADEVRGRQPQGGPAPDHVYQPRGPQKPDGDQPKLTEPQRKKIKATLSELDGNNEPVPGGLPTWAGYCKQWMQNEFGKDSSTQLTKTEASKLIDMLEAHLVPF